MGSADSAPLSEPAPRTTHQLHVVKGRPPSSQVGDSEQRRLLGREQSSNLLVRRRGLPPHRGVRDRRRRGSTGRRPPAARTARPLRLRLRLCREGGGREGAARRAVGASASRHGRRLSCRRRERLGGAWPCRGLGRAAPCKASSSSSTTTSSSSSFPSSTPCGSCELAASALIAAVSALALSYEESRSAI